MYNRQQIIGNLGKDPEVRMFDDGSNEVKFTVAYTERGFTTSTGKQIPDHTEWFNCVVKGNKAEFVKQYLHKGDRVFVEGKTYTTEYRDAQGQSKRFTEIRVTEVIGLSSRQQATDNRQQVNSFGGQQSYQPQHSFGLPQQGDLF